MARTVCCGATPGLLPLESALRKLPGIIAHLGFIPKSCQYVLLSRDGEKCAGEGFEPAAGSLVATPICRSQMGSCVAYLSRSASPSIAAGDTAKQNVSQAFAGEAKVATRSCGRGRHVSVMYCFATTLENCLD